MPRIPRSVITVLLFVGVTACAATSGGQPSKGEILLPGEGWSSMGHPKQSPDGETIAFIGAKSDDLLGPRLVVMTAGDLEVLTEEGMEVSALAWMPDSEQILVSWQDIDLTAPPHEWPSYDRLAVFDLAGRMVHEVPIRATERIRLQNMTVSGDGSFAVVEAVSPYSGIQPADLVKIVISTGEISPILDRPESDGHPVLLEGNRLLFTTGKSVSLVQPPNGRLAILDLTSREITPVTSGDEVVLGASATTDGKIIVYDAFPSGGVGRSGQALWRLSLDGGKPQRIYDAPIVDASVTPDNLSVIGVLLGRPGAVGGIIRLTLAAAT